MDYDYYVGIDIGSTGSKVAVVDGKSLVHYFNFPTGWNSKETANEIYRRLKEKSFTENMRCVATGYGRICVDYADKVVTEITCHGRGAYALFEKDCTVIDVGGQDTKIITLENGQVIDFLMNDKCAAGTGKFIMCTVFAESEVISHIGAGEKREDIASGVISSVAERVANLCKRHGVGNEVFLTGGLSGMPYFIEVLSKKLNRDIKTHPLSRYAGAIGAALTGISNRKIILEP